MRDTNGTYTHGVQNPSSIRWSDPERMLVHGQEVDVWRGRAVSTADTSENFALETDVAFLPDGITPAFVNVTHPLWIQTAAVVQHFTHVVNAADLEVPPQCA